MSLEPDEPPADLPVLDYAPRERPPGRWRVFFDGIAFGGAALIISLVLGLPFNSGLPFMMWSGPLFPLCRVLGVPGPVEAVILWGGGPVLYGIYTVVLVYSPRRWWYLAGILALHAVPAAVMWFMFLR